MAVSGVGPAGQSASIADVGRTLPAAPAKGAFGQIVEQLLNRASAGETQANQAVRDLAVGRTDNIHGVMLAVVKADLTFRMILEIRNRLTDALQEVLRMQI